MRRHPGHTLRTLLPAARAAVDAWTARRSNGNRNFAAVRIAMERLGKEIALLEPEHIPTSPRAAPPHRIRIRKLFPNTWFLDALAALDAERHGGATLRALAERYGYSVTRISQVLLRYGRGWRGSGPYWNPHHTLRAQWGPPPQRKRKQRQPKVSYLHRPVRLNTRCSACGRQGAPYGPPPHYCAACLVKITRQLPTLPGG